MMLWGLYFYIVFETFDFLTHTSTILNIYDMIWYWMHYLGKLITFQIKQKEKVKILI